MTTLLIWFALLQVSHAFVGPHTSLFVSHVTNSHNAISRVGIFSKWRVRHEWRRSALPLQMNHEDSIPPSEDSLVKATELQQTLTKLLSRRKLLLSATAVTGASLLSTSKAKATNNVPVDSASNLQAENTVLESGPLIGEYNKAPGKLIVYPDGIVEKSPSDKYAYRALTLPNGLRVLLASDPKADTAALAAILSPIVAIAPAGGPMKTTPTDFSAAANSAFSERTP